VRGGDMRGVWRLERSGRRHTPRGALRWGGWVVRESVINIRWRRGLSLPDRHGLSSWSNSSR
jgi:hypothetical protein